MFFKSKFFVLALLLLVALILLACAEASSEGSEKEILQTVEITPEATAPTSVIPEWGHLSNRELINAVEEGLGIGLNGELRVYLPGYEDLFRAYIEAFREESGTRCTAAQIQFVKEEEFQRKWAELYHHPIGKHSPAFFDPIERVVYFSIDSPHWESYLGEHQDPSNPLDTMGMRKRFSIGHELTHCDGIYPEEGEDLLQLGDVVASVGYGFSMTYPCDGESCWILSNLNEISTEFCHARGMENLELRFIGFTAYQAGVEFIQETLTETGVSPDEFCRLYREEGGGFPNFYLELLKGLGSEGADRYIEILDLPITVPLADRLKQWEDFKNKEVR